jgi:cytidyltransferase-like protein
MESLDNSLKSNENTVPLKRPVIVAASGYFSPLHSAHIEYLEKSKELGDYLVVIVNNDRQELAKKGAVFIECSERLKIVKSLKCVDMVVESMDQDRSVCETLSILRPDIFTNGGDQSNEGIPEAKTCNLLGIKLVDGLGDKKQSSSAIIARAKLIKDYKNNK